MPRIPTKPLFDDAIFDMAIFDGEALSLTAVRRRRKAIIDYGTVIPGRVGR